MRRTKEDLRHEVIEQSLTENQKVQVRLEVRFAAGAVKVQEKHFVNEGVTCSLVPLLLLLQDQVLSWLRLVLEDFNMHIDSSHLPLYDSHLFGRIHTASRTLDLVLGLDVNMEDITAQALFQIITS
ncbi:hypothetical protein UY3_10921 [Chelonia mydas]|uniref:Uncharacterized protein n=1 Tax=Chelonia mydas TaxID=8469 RepID=M7BV44_CHEMY|nr:hypothetical protein UY3_10921 [Chelonia mydas]